MKASRVVSLVASLGGAACVERVTAPGTCPEFCPSGSITVVDTVLRTSISRDSAYRGFVLPHQAGAMLAADLPGVVDSRAIFLTRPLADRVTLGADTTTHPVIGVDSLKLSLTITRRDTAARNLTLRVYRLPLNIDSTTTFADLSGAFTASPVRSVNIDSLLAKPGRVDSARGDNVVVDTATRRLTVVLKLDSAQAPYVTADTGRLAFGVGVAANSPTSVALGSSDAVLGPEITWFVKVDSISGKDTTLIHKFYPRSVNFDSFVFNPPLPPLDSTLAVGGTPSARSILRVALPRVIRDSSQIIRGTLILVPAVPARGASGDSFVIEAHTVLADFGAKSPIALDPTRTDTTRIRIGATDTVRIEVTNLMRFWAADTLAPTSIMLRSQEEGANLAEIRFHASAAAAYRPALRVTYAPRFPFGRP